MSSTPVGRSSPFRADLLSGKVALVTGGGSGICRGIAEELGRHGAKLVLMGRRAAMLEEACAAFQGMGIDAAWSAGDVRDAAQCAAAIEKAVTRFGGLDILVNGAAGNFLCAAEDMSPNAFKTVIEIDLQGSFQMARAALAALKSRGAGVILNISATLHYGGTPYQAHVSAAKAGIDALTLNFGTEWGPYGIRVVGIAPGPIAGTEGVDRLLPPPGRAAMEQLIPLRRMGAIGDIARAAVFLVSDAASYITCETLVVDGGSSVAYPPFVPPAVYEAIKAKMARGAASPT